MPEKTVAEKSVWQEIVKESPKKGYQIGPAIPEFQSLKYKLMKPPSGGMTRGKPN